jgi:hypothetical protein
MRLSGALHSSQYRERGLINLTAYRTTLAVLKRRAQVCATRRLNDKYH